MKAYKWILCMVLVVLISGGIFLFGNYKSVDSTVKHELSTAPEQATESTTAPFTFTTADFNERLIVMINAYREKNGLLPWAVDDSLSQAAQTRAGECAILESKSHNRPDGSGWYTTLGIEDESENYNYCELTGVSDQTPETLLRSWLASDSINSTGLLSEEYSICGIGCEAVGSTVYCAMILYKE